MRCRSQSRVPRLRHRTIAMRPVFVDQIRTSWYSEVVAGAVLAAAGRIVGHHRPSGDVADPLPKCRLPPIFNGHGCRYNHARSMAGSVGSASSIKALLHAAGKYCQSQKLSINRQATAKPRCRCEGIERHHPLSLHFQRRVASRSRSGRRSPEARRN